MNFRQKITLSLLLYIVLGSDAFAQVVDIPDSNLRAAIADALRMPRGASIDQQDMNRLTHLDVQDQGIANLTGLEFAINLRELFIDNNPMIIDLSPIAGLTLLERLGMRALHAADITPLAQITSLRVLDITECTLVDISPLSHLTNLKHLHAEINRIVDITPLANLTNLVTLGLNANRIIDITPLANLTNLVRLLLDHNRIVDVHPLAGLTQLQDLEIHSNRIVDHSPLNTLTLSNFRYDQACEMPPLPLEPRLENRNFPSIFARWSGFGWPPISNRPDLSDAENLARHDLRFSGGVFGLHFREGANGLKMTGVLDWAVQMRDEVHTLNPSSVHLVDVGIRAAPLTLYPEDSPYWIRDEQGNVFLEAPGVSHGLLDFTNPIVQDRIVAQAVAVSECGLYDGIFFRLLERELDSAGRLSNNGRRAKRPRYNSPAYTSRDASQFFGNGQCEYSDAAANCSVRQWWIHGDRATFYAEQRAARDYSDGY